MAKVIIGIHGLANKPPKPTLAEWWKDSIVEGLQVNCGIKSPTCTFEMVYWADLLYKYPLHRDNNFSFDKLYNTQPYLPARKGALKKYEASWLDIVRRETQRVLGGAVDRVKEYVGMDSAGDFLLARVLKDLDFYYDVNRHIVNRDGQRKLARMVLQEELEKVLVKNRANTIMLIAHSMGSIIAYDVVRNLGRTQKGVTVSRFVTIGSPLGLPYVKGKIIDERTYDRNEAQRVRTPSIVTQSWINFADKRDPVAFDTHLGDDYGPNAKRVRVVDDLIMNDYNVKGERNSHKSYGYLRAPEVSDHIRTFLGR